VLFFAEEHSLLFMFHSLAMQAIKIIASQVYSAAAEDCKDITYLNDRGKCYFSGEEHLTKYVLH
jgi:hypothetical protein